MLHHNDFSEKRVELLKLAFVLAKFYPKKVACIQLGPGKRLIDQMLSNLSDDEQIIRRISLHFIEVMLQQLDDKDWSECGHSANTIRKLF